MPCLTHRSKGLDCLYNLGQVGDVQLVLFGVDER